MILSALYLLKVCACSALLYLYYHVALRNKVFHYWNRFYLLAAVVISLVAPLLHFHFLTQTAQTADQSIHLLRVVQSANEYLDEVTITGQHEWGTSQWGVTVYLSVAVIFFLFLLHSLVRIYFLIRRHHVQSVAGIRFVNTNAAGAPFSFFRYIFWHQSIDVHSPTGQKIFQHELVHVSEKHSLDTVFMQMVLILFWCNPFFWLIRKELKVIHEFIADKKSVGDGGSASFAAMVLQSTYPDQFNSLVNSFFQTSIKRRILMLKKLQTPRLSYLSRMLALPVIVCSVLAFTVKAKRVQTLPLDRTITVVIDAGHGVQHNGVKEGAMANGMSEEEIVLSIAKNIQKMNGNKNIHIVLTRTSEEVVDLQKRVDIARENKADLFISLHMSAAVQNEARTQGMDIYVSNKKPFYQEQSEVFGSVLQQELSSVYEVNPDLLKRQVGIWVLDQNVCPSVLLECGFITSEKDRTFISNGKNQDAVAQKILSSIERFATSTNKQTGKNTLPSSKNYTEEMAVSELKYQQGISDKRPIPQSDTVPKISSNQIVTIHGDFTVGVNDTIPRAERIIRKTEVEAGINKGTWQSFLSTHLHDFLFSLAQKAPPGRYTAYLRFVVKTDGTVEDVTVVKDPGYGIGDKLVNVLKESPKWYPGLYNGVPVNSYHTQPVTLVIAPQ